MSSPNLFLSLSQDTDIHIGQDHPVHRKSPFTQQSRGCGLQGDFISFPYRFFTEWNRTWSVYGNPAKVFVHEWSKYRYGIFDEFGFAGDKLFPNYYKVHGEIVPTGSSDKMVKGSWMKNNATHCDPSAEKSCHFIASGNENDQVTCSLGTDSL